jgi:hypothetical protein
MSAKPSINEPKDEHVFLVTGELATFSSEKKIALGYVIAESSMQAIQEQVKIQPNLKVSGVVSLRDLKLQVENLEKAKGAQIPVLKCGIYSSDSVRVSC